MGVNSLLVVLFLGAVVFVFYDIEALEDDIQTQEKPMVSFYGSTSFTIDDKSVKSIVKSTEAYMYKNREEMVDATLLSRDKKNLVANFIKSDFATKFENDIYFDGNIFFQSSNGVNLKSEQLEYNILDKIVKNYAPFEVEHNNNTYRGEDIYYDTKIQLLKANNIQFGVKDRND